VEPGSPVHAGGFRESVPVTCKGREWLPAPRHARQKATEAFRFRACRCAPASFLDVPLAESRRPCPLRPPDEFDRVPEHPQWRRREGTSRHPRQRSSCKSPEVPTSDVVGRFSRQMGCAERIEINGSVDNAVRGQDITCLSKDRRFAGPLEPEMSTRLLAIDGTTAAVADNACVIQSSTDQAGHCTATDDKSARLGRGTHAASRISSRPKSALNTRG
jgi:hypothetical protein